MIPGFVINMAKLVSGDYTVPVGSIGYVESLIGETHVWMSWIGPPSGPGGGSGPIALADLEPLGELVIRNVTSVKPLERK